MINKDHDLNMGNWKSIVRLYKCLKSANLEYIYNIKSLITYVETKIAKHIDPKLI